MSRSTRDRDDAEVIDMTFAGFPPTRPPASDGVPVLPRAYPLDETVAVPSTRTVVGLPLPPRAPALDREAMRRECMRRYVLKHPLKQSSPDHPEALATLDPPVRLHLEWSECDYVDPCSGLAYIRR
jgi:hypothetical protein